MRVRINEKSLSVKLQKGLDLVEEKIKGKLIDIAEDLSELIPVDTGAYAESFSVGPKTRSRTSRNRPRKQSVSEYQGVAKSTMISDIESLDLSTLKSVQFRNRAPHAKHIEGVYQIFGRAKDKNR